MGAPDPPLDLGPVAERLTRLLGREGSVAIGGLHAGSLGHLLAWIARQGTPLLVVLPDPRALTCLQVDLHTFLGRAPAVLPAWPRGDMEAAPDMEVLRARAALLEHLAAWSPSGRTPPPVVLATLGALAQEVPGADALARASVALTPGASQDRDVLVEHLAGNGYRRVPRVEAVGEFALRGDVLDVWPWPASGPVRVDFFDDEVESIARMDPLTQRSTTRRDEVVLHLLPAERYRDPLAEEGRDFLVSWMPDRSRTVMVERPALIEAATRLRGEADGSGRNRLRRLEKALARSSVLQVSADPLGGEGDLDLDVGSLDRLRGIALQPRTESGQSSRHRGPRRTSDPSRDGASTDDAYVEKIALTPYGARHRGPEGTSDPSRDGASTDDAYVEKIALTPYGDRTERIGRAFAELAGEITALVIHRRAEGEEERLRALLEAHAPSLDVTWREGSLSRSFVLRDTRVAHVAFDDLADLPLQERRTQRARTRSRPIESFLELQQDGLVVHLHHGIGLYRGLETLETPDGTGEYLKIEFAEGTKVFVPVARIDLVQRYVGAGRPPRLSKLGGQEWSRRKQKVSEAVEALAEDLLATQAARRRRTGPALPADGEWQRAFEAAFPHEDTPDQAAATKALKGDLEGDRPMDRLLCGDVGFGKTEVALRAIFKTVTAGRQAAVLVPTRILAEQHARVFTQRLASWPVRVRTLSGLRTPAEIRAVLAGMQDGSVDVVVGTHRLLSKDVAFHNLGLLVVDEEQRFGVKHKERLKALRAEVDILSLSATPIPRTLHMALLGIRDISNLTTPPLGRHPIETRVAREDDALITEALRRELDRGGQVFVVTSRIRDLPVLAARLARLVPELRTTWIHGRMDKTTIERRMLRFVRGDADCLLATTIIESGLDIPNANTIIIRDADRYGLAELHQLRGRVGRERRRAHALILLPQERTVNPEARERLKAIEEYSDLGAGFRIAMRDLEIRGAGNLLGPQQSGHIAAVGYDLYCRMLADAVSTARGSRRREAGLAALGIDLPGGVPDDWVADDREKFRIFRRVAGVLTAEGLEALAAELGERFGPLPDAAGRLVLAQRVRLAAGTAGFERIEPGPEDEPGVILVGPDAARQALAGRGILVRALEGPRAFLPTTGAQGTEAILRRAVALLTP